MYTASCFGSANVEELYCGVVAPMNFTVDRSCMHLELTTSFSSAFYLCEGYPMKSTIITFMYKDLFLKESVSLLSVCSCWKSEDSNQFLIIAPWGSTDGQSDNTLHYTIYFYLHPSIVVSARGVNSRYLCSVSCRSCIFLSGYAGLLLLSLLLLFIFLFLFLCIGGDRL